MINGIPLRKFLNKIHPPTEVDREDIREANADHAYSSRFSFEYAGILTGTTLEKPISNDEIDRIRMCAAANLGTSYAANQATPLYPESVTGNSDAQALVEGTRLSFLVNDAKNAFVNVLSDSGPFPGCSELETDVIRSFIKMAEEADEPQFIVSVEGLDLFPELRNIYKRITDLIGNAKTIEFDESPELVAAVQEYAHAGVGQLLATTRPVTSFPDAINYQTSNWFSEIHLNGFAWPNKQVTEQIRQRVIVETVTKLVQMVNASKAKVASA